MSYKVIDENEKQIDDSEYRSIAIGLADVKAKETGKRFSVQEPSGEITYTTGARMYSNPQRYLVVKDWPSGMERVTAIFSVEISKKGERVSRITQSVSGRESKPKVTTYAIKAMIVTGDDGRTYIAELQLNDCVSIMQSNMKYQEEVIFQDSQPDRFAAIFLLFAEAAQTA